MLRRFLVIALLLAARLGADISAINAVPITTASSVMGVSPLHAVIGIAVVSGVTPPPLLSLAANGYDATYDGTPPTFDPVGAPVTFNVARQGYDATGASITVNDTLTLMSRVRQAYPNQASLTADTVVPSSYVYDPDVVAGVTNNSTRAYPQPGAVWINRDLETITSNSHTLRLAVSHGHARSGRPVAAVKYIMTDGTNTVEAIDTTTEYVSYSASGLGAPVFEKVMDTSTLTQGATVTIDAIIYPWVGEEFQLSVDADAYPSPNLTTLRAFNNRTGAATVYYAYVDPADATGGTASTNSATAAAEPFQTLALAAAAIKTAKGGTNTDLGIIRLVAADHTFSSIGASNTATWPLTIEAANPANKATTRLIASAAGNTTTSIPDHTVFRNITICRGSSSDHIMLDQNSAANTYTDLLVFENCAFSLNGFDTYSGFVYRNARTVFINCDGDNVGQGEIVGVINKAVKAIGCGLGYVSETTTFNAVACRANRMAQLASTASRVAGVGHLFGWNFITNGTSGGIIVDVPLAVGARGFHFVGNIIEGWGTTSNVGLKLIADSANVNGENIVVTANTVKGLRTNALYLETETNYIKSGYLTFNIFEEFNCKSDMFTSVTYPASANITGNWSARYKVGFRANAILRGTSTGIGVYDASSWLGDIAALGEVTGTSASPLTVNFVNDNSNYGSDDGGGDYTPGVGHALPLIPAGLAPYSHDLFGTPIPNNGTAVVGAVQIP
jgi:hypothetical protein